MLSGAGWGWGEVVSGTVELDRAEMQGLTY